ncbi:ATP synthase subunit alpha [compost metagenome]
MKQGQYSPVSVEKQVAIIYIGTKGLLRNVPVNKVREFEEEFLTQLEQRHPEVLSAFKAGKFSDELTAVLETVAKDLASKY